MIIITKLYLPWYEDFNTRIKNMAHLVAALLRLLKVKSKSTVRSAIYILEREGPHHTIFLYTVEIFQE